MGKAEDIARARLAEQAAAAALDAAQKAQDQQAGLAQIRSEIAELARDVLALLEELNYPDASISAVQIGTTGVFRKTAVYQERASWLIANNHESSDIAHRWWSVHLLSDGTFKWTGRGLNSRDHCEDASTLGSELGGGLAEFSILRPTLSGLGGLHRRLQKMAGST
jgi:hypothetical protein